MLKDADSTAAYGERLNRHLQAYKENLLRLKASGYWTRGLHKTALPHILPLEHAHLNVLPEFREEFDAYAKSRTQTLGRHMYFHHLNSSQAMCFNLFFPFCSDGHKHLPLLLDVLGLPRGEAQGMFEKVFDRQEFTNFDFCLEYAHGSKVFFEAKLSETGFGKADPRKWEEKYRDKFETHYREPLSGLVDAKWLEPERFMQHYQILRNISYLGRFRESRLFLVYPEANGHLRRDEPAIREIAGTGLGDRVRIVYLESLVDAILEAMVQMPERFQRHFIEFERKYIVR